MKKTLLTAIAGLFALTVGAQQRSAFVHMKSGEIKEYTINSLDSITFGAHVDYDREFEAKYSLAYYYGEGNYWVLLSDQPISDQAMPTVAGQTIVAFYAIANPDEFPHSATLPENKYVTASVVKPGVLATTDTGLTYVMICSGFNDEGQATGWRMDITNAEALVKHNADGTYYIDYKCDLGERNEAADFQRSHVTYNGPLSFICMDKTAYDILENDLTIEPDWMQGSHTSNADDEYSYWSIAVSNVPRNDDYITGGGDYMVMELITKYESPMNIDNLAGEYTVASVNKRPYQPGTFLSGSVEEIFGMSMPIGTYYNPYDQYGNATNTIAMAMGGSVKITTDTDSITIDADLTVEGGHTIKMKYTADKSTISDWDTYWDAPAAPTKTFYQRLDTIRKASLPSSFEVSTKAK